MLRVLVLQIAVTALLVPTGVWGADKDVETSTLLTPDSCYEHSPTEVVEKLEETGWFACEACIDQVCEVYAMRVRPLVDKRHREAARIRIDLLDAIRQFDQAFASVTQGNWFGHESARHAAQVEWFIIRTAIDRPDRGTQPYTREDFVRVMEMWYRTNASRDAEPAVPSKDTFLRTVDHAMDALSRAERHLSPDQVRVLRAMLMRRVARWL
jgi:hypothetical protein